MYRDSVLALEARLSQLREARAEIDTEIESTQLLLAAWRRRAPRSPWSWWLLAFGVLTGIGVIVLPGLLLLCCPRLCGPSAAGGITHARAETLHSAATTYAAQMPGAECPTVRDLIDEGYLHDEMDLTDGWGNPYWIECRRGDVVVRSDRFDGVEVFYDPEARTP